MIIVDAKELKDAIKTAKYFVSKDRENPMSLLYCKVLDNELTIIAMDRYKVMETQIKVKSDNNTTFYLRPEIQKFKKGDIAIIEIDNDIAILDINNEKIITSQKRYNTFLTDSDKILSEENNKSVEYMIAFNPKILSDALRECSKEDEKKGVIFRFTNYREPVLIEFSNSKRLVCPRMSKEVTEFNKIKKALNK